MGPGPIPPQQHAKSNKAQHNKRAEDRGGGRGYRLALAERGLGLLPVPDAGAEGSDHLKNGVWLGLLQIMGELKKKNPLCSGPVSVCFGVSPSFAFPPRQQGLGPPGLPAAPVPDRGQRLRLEAEHDTSSGASPGYRRADPGSFPAAVPCPFSGEPRRLPSPQARRRGCSGSWSRKGKAARKDTVRQS